MISFFAGKIGLGAFWQSSIFLFACSSSLMHCSLASGSFAVGGRRLVLCRGDARRQKERAAREHRRDQQLSHTH